MLFYQSFRRGLYTTAWITAIMRIIDDSSQVNKAGMEFSETWHVLGPFQIGTREATWGVDPLERYGGFANLAPGDKSYPSSLGSNGEVSWSIVGLEPPSTDILNQSFGTDLLPHTAVTLLLSFPDIQWSENQAVYGWSALQWQAWIRGKLTIHGSVAQTVRLQLPGILEFDIDGERHFGGDFFSLNRTSVIQVLQPGVHEINIRVVRDVRAMGAVGEPSFTAIILAEQVESGLVVLQKDILFPDFVVGHGFPSDVCSIPVQNTSNDWVRVVGIESGGDDTAEISYEIDSSSVSVGPGQTQVVHASFRPRSGTTELKHITFRVIYRTQTSSEIAKTQVYKMPIRSRQISEPHKTVFRLSNGASSYCLIQPPDIKQVSSNQANSKYGVPVMVVLHGAGVEIDGQETRDMLSTIGDVPAWMVVPTGGSQWSADDWHTWGFEDVQAAIAAIPSFIKTLNLASCIADLSSLYVVGHSNGGQGTWYTITHIPDRIRAAAPVSGYTSIQKYVPYSHEREVDPRLQSIIQVALSSYRHELLIENAKGIPIQQQHGDADDNVPVFHSRRIYQLLKDVGADTSYNEIPNKGHWYPGILATPPLKDFYGRIARHNRNAPPLPAKFSIIIPGTGDSIGSRGGILVEQLSQIGQLGRVDVERVSDDLWHIRTSNIRRLRIGNLDFTGIYPKSVQIDDDTAISVKSVSSDTPIWLYLDSESHWHIGDNKFLQRDEERTGMQFGTIQAVLRQPITIMYHSDLSYKIALQTSRNLRQYYSAGCEILHDHGQPHAEGNLITIKEGAQETSANDKRSVLDASRFPINVNRDGLKIKLPSGLSKTFKHCSGLGAIFLTPLEKKSLQLVIWGYDKKGLEQAARLAPGLTGVGQPDFIIFGPEAPWKGIGGALATGFFENDWSISTTSYIS